MLKREIFSLIVVPINNLRDVKTINGIVITHKRLIIAVSEIDKATSPLEKDVIILGHYHQEGIIDKGNKKLIFLGDGKCRSDLEKMTNQLNQSHRIFLKGVVKNVNNHLINCDFYLSASSSEGMSNALLESMALGVPAIASNVSGVDEIIFDNQNGLVFEPGDEKTFYEKIINTIRCRHYRSFSECGVTGA